MKYSSQTWGQINRQVKCQSYRRIQDIILYKDGPQNWSQARSHIENKIAHQVWFQVCSQVLVQMQENLDEH